MYNILWYNYINVTYSSLVIYSNVINIFYVLKQWGKNDLSSAVFSFRIVKVIGRGFVILAEIKSDLTARTYLYFHFFLFFFSLGWSFVTKIFCIYILCDLCRHTSFFFLSTCRQILLYSITNIMNLIFSVDKLSQHIVINNLCRILLTF